MKKGKLLYAALLVFLLITPNGLLAEEATESLKETYQKAEIGDAEAQYNLGEMYYNGEGVSQNDKEAVKWYLKAAEQGHAKAQFNLGLMYDIGKGVSQDYKEAVKWYSKAVRQGHAEAQRHLAICYAKGEGVPKDYKKAFELFSEAAEQGDVGAQACLGWMYYNGLGVTQNYKEATNWFSRAADLGDAPAQSMLGDIYYEGKGIPQDYKEAMKWYSKAAEQGDADAQFKLGLMYDTSKGVSQDYKEAFKWYSKAAEQGHVTAQFNLGLMYDIGKGVSQDDKEAFKWYSKAAEQGDVSAQYNLGMMYQKGQGVSQDDKEAFKWFSKAAEQGDADAKSMLGDIYYEGKGIPQDYKEAMKWYSKAAEQGHAYAQYSLGWMYENGEGMPQNHIEAYKWYNLAAAQGYGDAKEARDILRKKISPDHIIEAQRLSRDFRPRAADVVTVPEPVKVASTGKPRVQADKVSGEMKEGKSISKAAVDAFVDVDINIPKGKKKRPDGIAVIIGNGHYSRYGNGISNVTYAARDAAYMKRYVVETLGFDEKNVIYEQDVTQGSLATIFGTGNNYRGKLYNYVKAGKSDVFVYYTGHGAPDPAGKGAFLVPVDANVDYIASNGYPLDTFYKNLGKVREKIGSGRMTVILDACFSGDSGGGVLFRNISPAMIKTASPVGNLDEAVIFTSAGESEVSQWYPDKRHSLFTYFFMKGLQGDADRNKNKTITVGEMRDYLKENVPYLARRLGGREQNPVIVGEESLELVSFR